MGNSGLSWCLCPDFGTSPPHSVQAGPPVPSDILGGILWGVVSYINDEKTPFSCSRYPPPTVLEPLGPTGSSWYFQSEKMREFREQFIFKNL